MTSGWPDPLRAGFVHDGLTLSYLDSPAETPDAPALLALHGHLNEGRLVEEGTIPTGSVRPGPVRPARRFGRAAGDSLDSHSARPRRAAVPPGPPGGTAAHPERVPPGTADDPTSPTTEQSTSDHEPTGTQQG